MSEVAYVSTPQVSQVEFGAGVGIGERVVVVEGDAVFGTEVGEVFTVEEIGTLAGVVGLGEVVVFEGALQAGTVKGGVVRDYSLMFDEWPELRPELVEGGGIRGIVRGQSVDLGEAPPIVIVWGLHEQRKAVGSDSVDHADQTDLADAVAVTLCGFEVDGGEGGGVSVHGDGRYGFWMCDWGRGHEGNQRLRLAVVL